MIFLNLLKALPEILRLILLIMKESKDKKIEEDVKLIREAWERRDAETIRAIFNHSYIRDPRPDNGVRGTKSDSKARS